MMKLWKFTINDKVKKINNDVNTDMVSEKLYMKAEKLIEFAQNSKYSPENLKIRLKKYCDQKVIEKIKKDADNLRNSKILEIKDEESSKDEVNKKGTNFLCFDLYIYQSKGVSELLNQEEDEVEKQPKNKGPKKGGFHGKKKY